MQTVFTVVDCYEGNILVIFSNQKAAEEYVEHNPHTVVKQEQMLTTFPIVPEGFNYYLVQLPSKSIQIFPDYRFQCTKMESDWSVRKGILTVRVWAQNQTEALQKAMKIGLEMKQPSGSIPDDCNSGIDPPTIRSSEEGVS